MISRVLDMAPHVPGPILVVSYGEEGAMGSKQVGLFMHVEVGGVADVVPRPLEPSDHVVFPPAEKRPGTCGIGRTLVRADSIGAIE